MRHVVASVADTLEIPVGDGVVVADVAGDGRAVLLLHGWTLNRHAWRPQVEALAPDFRVIAIDRRGNGASTAPADLPRELDDLVTLLDRIGVKRVALVGMSQGTRVALAFAVHHPDRVAALCLQGAPLPYAASAPAEDGEAVPLAAMRALAAAGRLDELRRRWIDHPLMQLGASAQQPLLDDIAAAYDARDLRAPIQPLEVEAEALQHLPHPTLLVTGTLETAHRRTVARRVARMLPHAMHLEIPQGRHLCNLSHPAIFNNLLSTFLEANHDG